MTTLLVVALTGAAGAVCRYLLTYWVAVKVEARWPWRSHTVNWGTHLVNVAGALTIGVVLGVGDSLGPDSLPRAAIATGFLGSFTTFSTWTYETWRLWEEGGRIVAVFNAAGALVAGIAATVAGLAVAGAVSG